MPEKSVPPNFEAQAEEMFREYMDSVDDENKLHELVRSLFINNYKADKIENLVKSFAKKSQLDWDTFSKIFYPIFGSEKTRKSARFDFDQFIENNNDPYHLDNIFHDLHSEGLDREKIIALLKTFAQERSIGWVSIEAILTRELDRVERYYSEQEVVINELQTSIDEAWKRIQALMDADLIDTPSPIYVIESAVEEILEKYQFPEDDSEDED